MSQAIRWATLGLGIAIAAAAVAFSCKSTNSQVQSGSTLRDDQAAGDQFVSTTAAGEAPSCDELCRDTTTDVSWAICYSCRCKAAMGGWLPPKEDIQCQDGELAKKYKVTPGAAGATVQLENVTGPEDTCLNPDRLYFNCSPGHRVVTRVYQDRKIMFRKLCKRDRFTPDVNDRNAIYSETAMIAYNWESGATCFWDDRDNVINGFNEPDIDLVVPDAAEREQRATALLAVHTARLEGDSCVTCHDNDPFMFDPSYIGTNWITNDELVNGPYHIVKSDGTKRRVGKHLVSADAAACTSCHRITGRITASDNDPGQPGNTCAQWLDDAVGTLHNKPSKDRLMRRVGDAGDRWGFTVKDDRKWSYPYWMPDYNFMRRNSTPPSSQADWDRRFGLAVATIRKCCADPNATGCQWEWIPTDP